jgi:hypothetical protein
MKYVILYTTKNKKGILSTSVYMVSYGIPKTYNTMQDASIDAAKISKTLNPRVADSVVGIKIMKEIVERYSGYRRIKVVNGEETVVINESKKSYKELLPSLMDSYRRLIRHQKLQRNNRRK